MKNKILGSILIVVIAVVLLLNFTNKNYYYKTLWYNLPGIFDADIFDSREIHKPNTPQLWKKSLDYNQHELSAELTDTLKKYETISFVVIQHDSVVTEKYFDGTTDTTRSNSFSVAKTFVGALIGRAIKLGYIKSIDQPIGDFLPAYKEGDKYHITLRHLLTMSSGLDWDEAYSSLWSQTTEAYYGTDLQKQMLALRVKKKPGEYFEYKSCDTELLAMILTKATGMPVATFLEKELWQPLGAASNAEWSLDHKDGMEKAYCCIYATAKDFARLGALYLHQGNWKGTQLIDSSYIKDAVTASGLINPLNQNKTDFYGFQCWLIPEYKGVTAFYMRGILGQYVIMLPQLDMIIVRLGHKRGVKINNHYTETYSLIDEAVKINSKRKK